VESGNDACRQIYLFLCQFLVFLLATTLLRKW
jgi:hypothetical protein